MKDNNFVKKLVRLCFLLATLCGFGQTMGDLAFTGYNTDGDKDFSLVTLINLNPNTTIYFTDYEWVANDSITAFSATGTNGFLEWNTGPTIIKAGTVILFSDIDSDNNTDYSASIGNLISHKNINWTSSTGETIFAYTGTDKDTPTTFITGIKNGELDSLELKGTGLTAGVNFLELNKYASPDGGQFKATRSDKANYSDYLTVLVDQTNWDVNNTDGEVFLPFTKEAFTLMGAATTWTGAVSTTWNLVDNWDNGIPTSDSDVLIPKTANSPILSADLVAGNVILQTDASFTISGTLTNKGLLTANSGSSLIVTGVLNSELTYKRNLATTNWYLASSPVVGEPIETLLNKNTFAAGTDANVGIAAYENNTATWNYQTEKSTGPINSGMGYSVKLKAANDLVFTGSLPTNDVSIAIALGTSNAYNLIGNPYPAYIPANLNASASSNILTANSAQLSEETLWFWDQATEEYLAVNQVSDSRFIAPAQGFFISTKSDGGTFNFSKSMQSHQADVFNKTNDTTFKISLHVTNGTLKSTTSIYYISGATKNFDNGYDSSVFDGIPNSFKIYTDLADSSQAKKLAIQSVANTDYKSTILPIGIKSAAATLEFSIDAKNIPEEIHIYLEDKVTNTFTQLDKTDAIYSLTTNSDTDGTGRFYLHTKASSPLATEKVLLQQLSIYKTTNNTIKILGLKHKNAVFSLFSILGEQLINKTLTVKNSNEITLPSLVNGIYFIKLKTANGIVNKKILIK